MAKTSTPNSSAAPPSFESALQELEAIVHAMEAGSAPLEESLAAYERGVTLLRQCQETLNTAEKKLQLLESGVLRDFDAASVGSSET
jgi:exodeoxyribonuclease VII small subunit